MSELNFGPGLPHKVPPPLLFGGLLVSLVLGRVLGLSAPLPKGIRWAGIPLVMTGLWLGSTAFVSQRRAGTSPDFRQPTSALVVSGPYRITRNPIYLAMSLVVSGLSFLFGEIWALLLLPVVLLVLDHGVVQGEESYLEQKFGVDYLDYKNRVPRWF
ncbi:MAG: isoprenylcysteine carboxylmethyltransferase family protein [Anaerolineaceae bacterium]|nr:isoprenylcysteine carboxylmethyltransferase family protein [Anaerolineaceae bacterium]